jgi:hypothetical protein
MPWQWRKRGSVFVELFEDGEIGVNGIANESDRRWVSDVAEPELRAMWAEHQRRLAHRDALASETPDERARVQADEGPHEAEPDKALHHEDNWIEPEYRDCIVPMEPDDPHALREGESMLTFITRPPSKGAPERSNES